MSRQGMPSRVPVPVPMEECKRRAIEWGEANPGLSPASCFAEAIWPDNAFRAAQGAGAAASRVLVALRKDGRARWRIEQTGRRRRWGWEIIR